MHIISCFGFPPNVEASFAIQNFTAGDNKWSQKRESYKPSPQNLLVKAIYLFPELH